MDKQNKQRLEQLVRQGIVPNNRLPMLMQAMSNLHMGKQLKPTERDVLSKYMFNMTDIMLKDTTVFNRAKLHTQKTKYQTEETTVDDINEKTIGGVKILDGPEEEDNMRRIANNKGKKLSIRKREKYRFLSKELKREKKKADMDESVLKTNTEYQELFEAALECYGVSNIRDLPEDTKAEFFAVIDEAMKTDDLDETITKQHLKMAKGIAFDKRYAGTNFSGAEKAMEKVHKGLSDHPESLKHLKHANEEVEFQEGAEHSDEARARAIAHIDKKEAARQKFQKIKWKVKPPAGTKNAHPDGMQPDKAGNKVKLRGFGPDSSKGNMSNPSARAALMKKEEVEHIDELSKKTLGSYVKKAVGDYGAARNLTGKRSDSKPLNRHHQKAAWKRQDGIEKAVDKLTKEEVELTFEEMTPAQKAARIKVIAKASARVKSGDAAISAEKRAMKAAKADMKKPGARKGMAPLKRDDDRRKTKLLTTPDNHGVSEDIQQLRKMIKENTNKAEAYKLLAKLLNTTERLGEE